MNCCPQPQKPRHLTGQGGTWEAHRGGQSPLQLLNPKAPRGHGRGVVWETHMPGYNTGTAPLYTRCPRPKPSPLSLGGGPSPACPWTCMQTTDAWPPSRPPLGFPSGAISQQPLPSPQALAGLTLPGTSRNPRLPTFSGPGALSSHRRDNENKGGDPAPIVLTPGR